MQVLESNNMIVVKYDWREKRDKKRQMRNEFYDFIRGE